MVDSSSFAAVGEQFDLPVDCIGNYSNVYDADVAAAEVLSVEVDDEAAPSDSGHDEFLVTAVDTFGTDAPSLTLL